MSQSNIMGYFKKEYVFLSLILTLMLFSFLGSNMTIPNFFKKDVIVEGYSDKQTQQAHKEQAKQEQAKQGQAKQGQAKGTEPIVRPLGKKKFLSSDIYIGIPRSQIPIGQEHLYIRKSQVVPPVCPECPSSLNKDDEDDSDKCPPCASCKRCPEPAFICKEIPSDSSNPSANAYLPRPLLTNFGEFSM